MDNFNGKFWKVIALIFTIILVPLIFGSYAYTATYGAKLVDALVNNDRLRQQEDKDLAKDVQNKVDIVNREVAAKLDKIITDITDMKVALARLK